MMIKLNRLLKKTIFFCFLTMPGLITKGQVFSAENLLSATGFSKPKLEKWMKEKGFSFRGKDQVKDTILSKYVYTKFKKNKNKIVDSAARAFNIEDLKGALYFNYQTASFDEFNKLADEFKKAGFYCKKPADTAVTADLLFQHNEYTVRTFSTQQDTLKSYNLTIFKKIFPAQKDINYADDLLAFTSHEYLEFYFGKKNVKSDIYYFTDTEVNKCSVVFSNTDRQVVYIWKDDANKRTIDHLLFGGQQKLESLRKNDNFIAENNWPFKSGLYAGMTLYQLRKLNGGDFKFYGGNSANSLAVLPAEEGKVNFKRENIILGCMNCKDEKYTASKILSADEALADERILFILTIALNPEAAANGN
jgi:hypothetical protein